MFGVGKIHSLAKVSWFWYHFMKEIRKGKIFGADIVCHVNLGFEYYTPMYLLLEM